MSNESENSEISNEPLNERNSIVKVKMMRMFHTDPKGNLCHAFDIFYNAYLLWKSGGTMLRASDARLPDGTIPDSYSKLCCGTCKKFPGNPKTMTATLVEGEYHL